MMSHGSSASEAIVDDDVERGLTNESYEEAYRAWRHHLAAFDWCIDTGRFGSIGEPGVSDLDCVALVRNGCHRLAIDTHKHWLAAQTRERRFLFPHEPLFITEAAVALVPRVHTLYGLRWDGGTLLDTAAVPKEISLFPHLAYALTVAPECARRMERKETLPLRELLLLLKSLHASEEYWETMATGESERGNALARSRRLRRAVLKREFGRSELAGILIDEMNGSIARLSQHLDVYGSKATGITKAIATYPARPERFTRVFGRISAGERTKLDPREHETVLHANVFALAFGPCRSGTPLGAASIAFWDAIHRIRTMHVRERLSEDWYFPRPFYYQPGVDDGDLSSQEFSCVALPAATACRDEPDGRMSTGTPGHLVHGPYVRIQNGRRYGAVLRYWAIGAPDRSAGFFEVVASRLDRGGQQTDFCTLCRVALPATGGQARDVRVEFDTSAVTGMLLETRVYVEEGVTMKAFHIRTCGGP